jgi:H+-translocating NAD(P) transhydrogenase subunit alpha
MELFSLFAIIVVFILSVFLGIELISRVPTTLHTPLMSGTNAIHGIVLVGAMIVLGAAGDNILLMILGFIAVIFGAGNVVGGFVVTDRMLQMFRRKPNEGGKK